MSMLIFLGSIGIGAVIGWLIGFLEPPRWRITQILAVASAILLVLFDVAWLVGWQASLVATGSILTMFLIHRLWRRELRKR